MSNKTKQKPLITTYNARQTMAKWKAEDRGHNLGKFVSLINTPTKHTCEAICLCCGMSVQVNDNPSPNEIAIGGEAVAMNCKSVNP